ncbi:MAG: MBL fold metallo-hydrolase [Dehalococcoidia bacterium]|nr:MBL fold metallo-hydrolase [Dehalococcoidia bacterium]
MLHRSLAVASGVQFYLWVGRGINSNSVVLADALDGAKPHVLIDPGMTGSEMGEPALDSLSAAMAADGLRLEDVGLVIGTHCHPDHFEAVDEVVRRSGAGVALSVTEQQFRSGDGRTFYGSFGADAPSSEPTFLLREGPLQFRAGDGLSAEVLITPGHTPGSACLYLPDLKVLVSGDVVFPGSIGRTDFVGGSMSQMRRSIARLSELDVDYILPGHSSMGEALVAGKDNVVRNFQMVRAYFF